MICEYLFVYGTLRQARKYTISRLLAAHAVCIGRARWQGKLFLVDDYPGAIPSQRVADRVVGELYRLLDPTFVLEAVDKYEECSAEFPEPREYVRRKQPVTLQDGRVVDAWIYIYNRPTEGLQRVDTGDYMASQSDQA